MNHRLSYFFLLFLALSGCETVVSSDGLPYVDHLVIRGFLNAGQPIDSISVSHTLPLSSWYDPNQAAVPDAQVSITVDGRAIPLGYVGFGNFRDTTKDTVVSGKTYRISVDWNGHHAEASTLVPQAPVVDSFYAGKTVHDTFIFFDNYLQRSDTSVGISTPIYFGARVHTNEYYSLLFDSIVYVTNIGDTVYDNFFSGTRPIRLLGRAVEKPDGHVWWDEFTNGDDSLIYCTAIVGSFDAPYYDFLQSYNYYSNGGDIFSVGGANPKWNVTGDGIGIFIGEAQTKTSFTFHR